MGRDDEWEAVLGVLGERCWDEATELTSMIADDAYPTMLRDEVMRRYAAKTVVSLCRDSDYRRCIEGLLAHTQSVGRVTNETERDI